MFKQFLGKKSKQKETTCEVSTKVTFHKAYQKIRTKMKNFA